MAKNFIKGAIKHPGALHRELGVPQGKKIPEKMLEKAAKAPGKLGQRARFAEELKGFHKSSGDRNPGGTSAQHARSAQESASANHVRTGKHG